MPKPLQVASTKPTIIKFSEWVVPTAPSAATRPPMAPAVWVPAKVAQFTPRLPGVISAMAMRLVRSSALIQPWLDISSRMSGIIEVPPKLVKPMRAKAKNSCTSVSSMFLPLHPDQRGHNTRQDQHNVADAREVADGQRRQADEDAHLILQGLFAQRQFYGEELCYFHIARVETSRPLALVYPRSSYQSAPLKAMLELFRIQVPKLYGL